MQHHSHTPHEGHKAMFDINHATWRGIGRVASYGVIAVVILLTLMATFLTKHAS
ncbi:MAG TPA: hypothetical protein VHB73_01230 [Alphaproteobacteria bacterium]|nr:hypothetical protein [Alphaproteobacteria bacterium]